jgi:hypothetical protein
MIHWRKLGPVYCADGRYGWSATHALCPTPVLLEGGQLLRVFCAFLDADSIGRCGWVDVSAKDPTEIVEISTFPALDVGRTGTFDEHGVTPLSIIRLPSGDLRLYYAGWQRGVGVRYSLFTGGAESSDDGLTFTRISEAPLLDRSDNELHTRTGGLVEVDDSGWQMWYAGGTGWEGAGMEARPRYALRHVRSHDGISWPSSGEVCLEPRDDELGFGRPGIIRRDGILHMWYGRRGLSGAYQLGYAVSHDGITWTRMDHLAHLPLGAAGEWDSDMVGLSSLVTVDSHIYLFYNGNGYGATGFGVAVAGES